MPVPWWREICLCLAKTAFFFSQAIESELKVLTHSPKHKITCLKNYCRVAKASADCCLLLPLRFMHTLQSFGCPSMTVLSLQHAPRRH
mmetsp:Transcript_9745/g.16169  ORF Transcript_9745/g.16169 Transcript_9745/m.16169 type:complete len:88 (+) Transcript_9745:328-591(+)